MFTISVETTFQASHRVGRPDGSPEPEHKHTWLATAAVRAERLDSNGFAIDFDFLKKLLDEIVGAFDQGEIGQIEYFKGVGPSAENVARYIYEQLEPRLPRKVRLEYVEVDEQAGCRARFYKS